MSRLAHRRGLDPAALGPGIRCGWILGLGLVAAGACAQPVPDRQALVQERAAIEARFHQAEQACQTRFFVTACLEEARSRRREALAPLREQELAWDEAERQQRAQTQRAEIEARQLARAQRPPPVSEPVASAPRRLPPPGVPHASIVRPGAASAAAQTRQAQAQVRVQAAARRASEAQQAQARVQRRLQAQREKGGEARPLPPPGSPESERPGLRSGPAASSPG